VDDANKRQEAAQQLVKAWQELKEEGERLIALSPGLADALAQHYATTTYKADENYVFGHPKRGTKLDHEWYAGEFGRRSRRPRSRTTFGHFTTPGTAR
jgi:hypothetical protein